MLPEEISREVIEYIRVIQDGGGSEHPNSHCSSTGHG